MSYIFLKKDFLALQKKIGDVSDEMKRVNDDMAKWVEQSSETWHDNFGFEEGDRQRKAIMNRLDELHNLRNNAKIVNVEESYDDVQVGVEVAVKDEDTGELKSFIISSYIVFDKVYSSEVSYDAPLGRALLGAEVGDTRELIFGAKEDIFEIISINPARF